jgi:hypothetical protein
LLVTANVVPSSLILVTLMMEALPNEETALDTHFLCQDNQTPVAGLTEKNTIHSLSPFFINSLLLFSIYTYF